MLKVFIFLLAFGITVMGFTYIIMYLNLLSMGYDLKEYLSFISTKVECIMGFIGFIVINIIILMKGDNYDLHL